MPDDAKPNVGSHQRSVTFERDQATSNATSTTQQITLNEFMELNRMEHEVGGGMSQGNSSPAGGSNQLKPQYQHAASSYAPSSFTGKDVFFNASLVIEDISLPQQSFTVSGYFECWWQDKARESSKSWDLNRMNRWVHKRLTLFGLGDAEVNTICQNFKDHCVDGRVLQKLNELDLKELGIKRLGHRKKFIEERNLLVERESEHHADPKTGIIKKMDHLRAPMNWEDLFYNATSEEFLTPPLHRRIEDPSTKRHDTIWGLYHIRATLLEMMELENFPRDRQFMDARLTVKRDKFNWLRQRPVWVPPSSEGVTIIGNDNNQILQVRLSEKLEGEYILCDPLVDFNTDDDAMLLRIRVQRKLGYYVHHVFLPIFLIVISSFGTFAVAIEPDDNGNFDMGTRMEITVTFFLVVIAYQLIVKEMLPTTSITTALDQYVTISFIYMTTLVFENAMFCFIPVEKRDLGKKIDQGIGIFMTVTWILLHCVIYWFSDLWLLNWESVAAGDDNSEVWLPASEKPTLFCEQDDDGTFTVVDADFQPAEHYLVDWSKRSVMTTVGDGFKNMGRRLSKGQSEEMVRTGMDSDKHGNVETKM